MVAFLAALPAIFSAIGTVTGLLDEGKKLYEEVTGTPSQAVTTADLEAEVANLPPAQANAWAEQMKAKVEMYRAETERLRVEQGDLTPDMLAVMGPEAAKRVAIDRMTFRPWAGRVSMYILATPMAILWVDTLFIVVRNIAHALGYDLSIELVMDAVFRDGSLYASVYGEAVPWATSIVLSLIGLRHLQKSSGQGASLGGQIGSLVTSVTGLFKKRK